MTQLLIVLSVVDIFYVLPIRPEYGAVPYVCPVFDVPVDIVVCCIGEVFGKDLCVPLILICQNAGQHL